MKRSALMVAGFVALSAAVVVAPGLAQNAGTNDYSSGFGYLDDAETPGDVGYEVIATTPTASAPAQGRFDFRRSNVAGQGKGFHASAVCIDAEENQAVIGLRIEQSTDPNYRVGEYVEAKAVDDVDGNGGARTGDGFDLDEESTSSTPDCREDDDQFSVSPIRGDIVVEDGGFATLPALP